MKDRIYTPPYAEMLDFSAESVIRSSSGVESYSVTDNSDLTWDNSDW